MTTTDRPERPKQPPLKRRLSIQLSVIGDNAERLGLRRIARTFHELGFRVNESWPEKTVARWVQNIQSVPTHAMLWLRTRQERKLEAAINERVQNEDARLAYHRAAAKRTDDENAEIALDVTRPAAERRAAAWHITDAARHRRVPIMVDITMEREANRKALRSAATWATKWLALTAAAIIAYELIAGLFSR